MNAGVTKTDFIYFQNEVLKDIKNLEVKFNEKTKDLANSINSNKTDSDSNFKKFELLFEEVMEKINFSTENSKLGSQLQTFQKKLEDLSINSRVKINSLEREINNIVIKYDKIFINNLVVPGLIGTSCPYPTLGNFIDNANKKINDLIIEKKKHGLDMKAFKEKLENLISVFNNRVNSMDEKFKEYCNLCFTNYDNKSNDRYKAIEDKIDSLRMENVKHSSELIQKTNELKLDWDKMQSIKEEIYDKFNLELSKFNKHNNDLIKIFENQKQEFSLIKSRFTELSGFIKDVRFRNNLINMGNANNTNNNNSNNNKNIHPQSDKNLKTFDNLSPFQKKVKFTAMSKRINFKVKQKLNESSKSIKAISKLDNNQIPKARHSPAKTEINDSILSSIEVEKNKDNKEQIINKPIIHLENAKSSVKEYFNSNKNSTGQKENKMRPFHSSLKDVNQYYIEGRLKKEIKTNNSDIKKESDEEIPGEDERIRSIINKKNSIQSAKTKEIEKKESTISDIDKEKLSPKILPKLTESQKIKKNKKSKFNKNIKTSPGKKKKFEQYKSHNFINEQKININKAESIEQNNLKQVLTLKIKKDDDNDKPFKTMTRNNSQKQEEEKSSNKSSFSDNSKEKITIKNDKNKFLFLTNPNLKEVAKNNNMNTIESNNPINIIFDEEDNNLDFNLLDKKITNTNKRLTELYSNTDKKMNKIIHYVKNVFEHLSGIFYFKNLHNKKFNFDNSPPTLKTSDYDFTFPLKQKNKILLKQRNSLFTPQNLKKHDTYKSLVNKIEPYLIKKFKE